MKNSKYTSRVEKWTTSQLLEYILFKLKKKAKNWFGNLIEKLKQKFEEQFLSFFFKNLILRTIKILELSWTLADKAKKRFYIIEINWKLLVRFFYSKGKLVIYI